MGHAEERGCDPAALGVPTSGNPIGVLEGGRGRVTNEDKTVAGPRAV
jgi:hypothetical protein